MSDEQRDEIRNLRWAVLVLANKPLLGSSSMALIKALALDLELPEDGIGIRPFDEADLRRNWDTYDALPEAWKPRAREIILESERRIRVREAAS